MEPNHSDRLARYNQLRMGYDEIYRQAAQQAGISFVPYYILLMLRCTPALHTQADIQRLSFYPKQTINSAVMRLMELGYLTLRPQGRRKLLEITQSGVVFCEKWVDPIWQAEDASFLALSPQEQEQLIGATEKHLSLFRQRAFPQLPKS